MWGIEIMTDKLVNMKTTEEKSMEIAKRRVETVLHQLKLIGNLSNSYYSLSELQIKDITNALDDGIKDAKKKLGDKSNKTNGSKLFNPKW